MTTIQLTDTLTEKNKYVSVYYITGVDEQTKDRIFEARKENKLKDLDAELGIKCSNILKYDKTSECKPSSLAEFLSFFKGANKGEGREIHFRDYSISFEQQKESAWLINKCPDSKASALSVLRRIKEPYIFLWRELGYDGK